MGWNSRPSRNVVDPRNDVLIIDVDLLLNYTAAYTESYRSVGVRPSELKRAPYHTWLPKALRVDLLDSMELQVTRDHRLVDYLFTKNSKVDELHGLDLAHLFIEAGASVIVTSYETPDALDALVARAGLPEHVTKIALVDSEQRVENLLRNIDNTKFNVLYQLGLTPANERGINDALAGRGVLVNVINNPARATGATDSLLKLVEERWTR